MTTLLPEIKQSFCNINGNFIVSNQFSDVSNQPLSQIDFFECSHVPEGWYRCLIFIPKVLVIKQTFDLPGSPTFLRKQSSKKLSGCGSPCHPKLRTCSSLLIIPNLVCISVISFRYFYNFVPCSEAQVLGTKTASCNNMQKDLSLCIKSLPFHLPFLLHYQTSSIMLLHSRFHIHEQNNLIHLLLQFVSDLRSFLSGDCDRDTKTRREAHSWQNINKIRDLTSLAHILQIGSAEHILLAFVVARMTSFSFEKLCRSFKQQPLGVNACLTTIIKLNEMKQRQSAPDQLHCLELRSQLKFDTLWMTWRKTLKFNEFGAAVRFNFENWVNNREHNLPLTSDWLPLTSDWLPQSSNPNSIFHRRSLNLIIHPDTKTSNFFPDASKNPFAVIE